MASNLASKAIMKISYNPEKEKLIENREKEKFFLHEEHDDPLKAKAMEKYNKTQMAVSKSMKYIPIDKPGVSEYYEKCVE